MAEAMYHMLLEVSCRTAVSFVLESSNATQLSLVVHGGTGKEMHRPTIEVFNLNIGLEEQVDGRAPSKFGLL